jgi:hypothetical protein
MNPNLKLTRPRAGDLFGKVKPLFIFFFLCPVFTFAYQSELTIRIHNDAEFVLQLNNIQYNEGNYYHIRNLAPGSAYIEVFELVHNSSAYHPLNPVYKLRFSGYIELMAGYRVNVMIDQFNRCVVLSNNPLSVTMSGPEGPEKRCANRHRTKYGHAGVMSEAAYLHLLHTLSENSFDNSRLSIARQAVAANKCTAEQVLGIMEQFSFESTKLSFAKYAYSFCINKGSYFIVTNGFTFESSKRELMRYTQMASLPN